MVCFLQLGLHTPHSVDKGERNKRKIVSHSLIYAAGLQRWSIPVNLHYNEFHQEICMGSNMNKNTRYRYVIHNTVKAKIYTHTHTRAYVKWRSKIKTAAKLSLQPPRSKQYHEMLESIYLLPEGEEQMEINPVLNFFFKLQQMVIHQHDLHKWQHNG